MLIPQAAADGRWAVVPLLPPASCYYPVTGRPPRRSRPPCPIAYGRSSFRTWLRDPREQGTDLGLPVPAVAAEGTDRRQLAGLCPACDRLGIHPEHGRHLCRREQRLGEAGKLAQQRTRVARVDDLLDVEDLGSVASGEPRLTATTDSLASFRSHTAEANSCRPNLLGLATARVG